MNNIYENNTYGDFDFESLLSRLDRIEASNKRKGKKRKNKKHKHCKKGYKKLMRRLEAIELENQQMKYLLLQAISVQQKKKTFWLKDVLMKSTPKLIDFASAIYQGKRQPKPRVIYSSSSPLLLTDGRNKK